MYITKEKKVDILKMVAIICEISALHYNNIPKGTVSKRGENTMIESLTMAISTICNILDVGADTFSNQCKTIKAELLAMSVTDTQPN